MDRIARIDKAAFTSGLFLDQKQQTAPLWVDGENVMFGAGTVQVFPGSVPLFNKNASSVITGIGELSSIVTGHPGLCYGTLTTLNLWDSTLGYQSVGTGFGGVADQTDAVKATRWSIQQWNEWIVATNGYDPMQLLKVVGTGFVAMTSATSTQFKKAEIIRKFRQFLIAFDLTLATGTRQPNAAAWCDVNDVETWVPATTNSARKIFIPDLESSILCAEMFGDNCFMYSDDSSYALQYKGYPNVFEPLPLPLKGIGVYGKNCVAMVPGGRHVGLGPRGVWQTDGSSFDYIDTPDVKKYLAANLNANQASKSVVYYDKTIGHLIIFFPHNVELENDAGLALNIKESKWTKITFGRTAAIDSGIFPYGLTGDSLGNIYRQSLADIPATSTPHSSIPITSGGFMYTGYGQGGYGNGGYGGVNVI